ncbi:hypothetical protein CAPTEDRAFT_220601 [Capitella teleta]|uniref:Caveolin n=1 Tax=Capitella teleta TaxID=283909 RepID=R7U639_CAPTE|nr:hypothetical protein CAPTEDRAFT_220601 [Capitella teleta]|eukprot:ELT98625.1 hypothetical protein CAPTEDRAFT_220601 [Capitella teleta]
MEAITDSEAPQSDHITNPTFERGGVWMSSFHGDRYMQEDIYKVTDHVKVGFDDIFAEPSATKAGDVGQVLSPSVRKVFSLVFGYTQSAIYYFLTILTGVFLGLTWGALFGTVNYFVVWPQWCSARVQFIIWTMIVAATLAGSMIGLTFGLRTPPLENGGSPPDRTFDGFFGDSPDDSQSESSWFGQW